MAATTAVAATAAGGVPPLEKVSFTEYMEWAKSTLHVRVHANIAVEDMPAPYGRGVVARSHIAAGKPLVTVPRSSLLSLQSLDGHPVEGIMGHVEELDVREDDLLAIMLLHEKHIAQGASKWSHHIAHLPASFDSVHFFNPAEEAALKGTAALAQLTSTIQQQVRQDYARMFPLLFEHYAHLGFTPEVFTLEEYRWAIACIWSRFVTITIEDRPWKVMAPVFDMHNHDPTARMTHKYVPETDALVVTTGQAFPAGSQVNLNYGALSNERLLMLHGFAVPNNPYDIVTLSILMAEEAPDFEAKSALLKEAGLHPSVNRCMLTATGLNPDVLTVLRITRSTAEELPAASAAVQGGMVSIGNERRVLGELKASLEAMLADQDADTPKEEAEQALASILLHLKNRADEARAAVVADLAAAARAKAAAKKAKKSKKGKKGRGGGSKAAPSTAAVAASTAAVETKEEEEEEGEEEGEEEVGAGEGEEVDVEVETTAALVAAAAGAAADVDLDALQAAVEAQHGPGTSMWRLAFAGVVRCSERFILRNQIAMITATQGQLEAYAASQGSGAEEPSSAPEAGAGAEAAEVGEAEAAAPPAVPTEGAAEPPKETE